MPVRIHITYKVCEAPLEVLARTCHGTRNPWVEQTAKGRQGRYSSSSWNCKEGTGIPSSYRAPSCSAGLNHAWLFQGLHVTNANKVVISSPADSQPAASILSIPSPATPWRNALPLEWVWQIAGIILKRFVSTCPLRMRDYETRILFSWN